METASMIYPDKIGRHHTQAILNVEQEKYYNLVWYARSDKNSHCNRESRAKIETLYPALTKQLCSKEEADWAHGFNSGMLACLRVMNGGKGLTHESIEEFPMLDS